MARRSEVAKAEAAEEKRKAGRPLKEIDARKVVQMAEQGMTVDEIAAHLDCSAEVLDKRFTPILKKGKLLLYGSLRHKQVQLALAGDRTMLIWLGKQMLGQKDSIDMNNEGKYEVKVTGGLPD